jgi:hypothetical protein
VRKYEFSDECGSGSKLDDVARLRRIQRSL